jgi:hypothetical protein
MTAGSLRADKVEYDSNAAAFPRAPETPSLAVALNLRSASAALGALVQRLSAAALVNSLLGRGSVALKLGPRERSDDGGQKA